MLIELANAFAVSFIVHPDYIGVTKSKSELRVPNVISCICKNTSITDTLQQRCSFGFPSILSTQQSRNSCNNVMSAPILVLSSSCHFKARRAIICPLHSMSCKSRKAHGEPCLKNDRIHTFCPHHVSTNAWVACVLVLIEDSRVMLWNVGSHWSCYYESQGRLNIVSLSVDIVFLTCVAWLQVALMTIIVNTHLSLMVTTSKYRLTTLPCYLTDFIHWKFRFEYSGPPHPLRSQCNN